MSDPHFIQNLCYLAVIILLPSIPAYILFRFFPESETEGEGPYGGFKWKLTGAFAGYVLVLMVAVTFFLTILRPARAEIWNVEGTIALEKRADPRECFIAVRPPNPFIGEDGRFAVDVVVRRGSGSPLNTPSLMVIHKDHAAETVPLTIGNDQPSYGSRYSFEDQGGNRYIVNNTVSLRANDPYQ